MGYIIYSLDSDKFKQLVERPTPAQLAALGKRLHDEFEAMDGEFDEDDPVASWPKDAKGLAEVAAKRLALPDWYGDLSTSGKTLWEVTISGACMNDEDLDVDFRVDSDGVSWDVVELAWKHLGVVPKQISGVALSAFGARPYRYHPTAKPATSRADFDKTQAERQASLGALGNMLGRFLEGAKEGKGDTAELLKQLESDAGVSQEHKGLIKGYLNDDDDFADDFDDENDAWAPMHSMHPPEEVGKMLAELKSVQSALKKSKNKDVLQEYEEELLPALEAIASEGRMLFVQVDT